MTDATEISGDGRTYLADTYRGHHIAILKHASVWLAYLDKVLQTNARFATAADASTWLRKRIDASHLPT